MSPATWTPQITITGLGSLLSERSSRTTFPTLANFRLGRVHGYRRVFAHPAAIFVERGIADLPSLQIASLSAEPCEGASFVCTVFEVEDEGMDRFREREEEFELVTVPVGPLEPIALGASAPPPEPVTGLMCCRSTDEAYIQTWGEEVGSPPACPAATAHARTSTRPPLWCARATPHPLAAFRDQIPRQRAAHDLGPPARQRRAPVRRLPAALRAGGGEDGRGLPRLLPRRDVPHRPRHDHPSVSRAAPRGHEHAAAARPRGEVRRLSECAWRLSVCSRFIGGGSPDLPGPGA